MEPGTYAYKPNPPHMHTHQIHTPSWEVSLPNPRKSTLSMRCISLKTEDPWFSCAPRKMNQSYSPIPPKNRVALNRFEMALNISSARMPHSLWIPSTKQQQIHKFQLSHYRRSLHVKMKINPFFSPGLHFLTWNPVLGSRKTKSLRLAVVVHYTPKGLSHLTT